MTCPLCGARRARRACPAVGRDICPVCCGTKRLVEIPCPDSCGYLRAAQAHPPAVQARQRERDAQFIMPMVHQLTEQAYGLLLLLQQVVRRHRDRAIPSINDEDVAQATAALAATLETSARGIIYDHQPASLPAQRLLDDLRGPSARWPRHLARPRAWSVTQPQRSDGLRSRARGACGPRSFGHRLSGLVGSFTQTH